MVNRQTKKKIFMYGVQRRITAEVHVICAIDFNIITYDNFYFAKRPTFKVKVTVLSDVSFE